MHGSADHRGEFSSKIGFIFAAAGSAIGLGNIWRFPYVTGQNGGAAFVFVYLISIVLICLPYMFGELSLGRFTQRNPVGAIRAVRPGSPWVGVGALGVLTGFFILSYYGVIAGWTLGFIFKTFNGHTENFQQFIADPVSVIPLFLLFILFTILVVYGGVQNGIERWSKILMPVLFVLMILLIVRSVTLEGAGKGLEFYLKPDFSKITGTTVLAALGQAFFSLSLGMGAMVTYGSYLSKKDNMVTSGVSVAIFDTMIALLAGFIIFPALFAVGEKPDAGPSLVFITLPKIFAQMPLGNWIGAAFFILLSIAALTSTISLLEVAVSYMVDERKWRRKLAVWLVGGISFLIGLPSALSQGAVDAFTHLPFFGGKSFLDLMDFIWGNVSLALGALLLSIFIGWVWGIDQAIEEINTGNGRFKDNIPGLPISYGQVWGFFMKYLVPVIVAIVLINVFQAF